MLNYIDAILLILFFLIIYQNYRIGFLESLLGILILAVSLLAAFYFYSYLATIINNNVVKMEERILYPLSFFLIFVTFQLLFNYIMIKTVNHTLCKNQITGIIPGLIKGYFITVLFSFLFLNIPIEPNLTQHAQESYFANYLTKSIEFLDHKIASDYSEEFKQQISNLNIEPETNETVYLNFKVTDAVPNEEFENHLLVLVNKERRNTGLKPLARDIALKKVARAHANDMLKKGYFSHISLNYKTPFDRIKEAGINYKTAGENLAFAQSVKIAHTGLMNSPGHKANILNPKFGKIGIGILDAGIHGIMVTQNFKD